MSTANIWAARRAYGMEWKAETEKPTGQDGSGLTCYVRLSLPYGTMSAGTDQEPPRYRLFGGLRFLLAMMVLVSHSQSLSGGGAGLLQEIGLGNPAVMGFFVLSGFIICEAAVTFYRARPVAFIANRFWRIAPPYFAALMMSITIHYALVRNGTLTVLDATTPPESMFTWQNVMGNILGIFPRPGFMHAAVPGGYYGFVRFAWAVYVEVEFYLAVFLILAIGTQFGRVKQFAIVAAVLALTLHTISEYFIPLPLHAELAFVPYFVLGAALFGGQSLTMRAGAAISYVLVFLHFSRYIQGRVPISSEWAAAILVPGNFLAVAILMSLPLLIVILVRLSASHRAQRIDRRIGDLSYPLYLNHFVIIVAATSLLPSSLATVLTAVFVSLALSAAMTKIIETPLKPLRDRLRGRQLEDSETQPKPKPTWTTWGTEMKKPSG